MTISAGPDSATGNYQFSIEQAKKSQAGKLAADIAMARDVLASLHHS